MADGGPWRSRSDDYLHQSDSRELLKDSSSDLSLKSARPARTGHVIVLRPSLSLRPAWIVALFYWKVKLMPS
uniref:Uncharacterized protein n=1 Tax=Heterorhabditis bacteriophora TaxID=37862 RepID=A0A1I7XL62_HETBA